MGCDAFQLDNAGKREIRGIGQGDCRAHPALIAMTTRAVLLIERGEVKNLIRTLRL
jgi:hypothetical protein